MKHAHLRFYADLNDFLPAERNAADIVHAFDLSGSVKDSIEALGIPHTEVDLIVVNDAAVDFSYLIQDGDHIAVYPSFRSLELSDDLRLRPRLTEFRFVADVHLGRLAGYLRMLGLNTLYRADYRDDELARLSSGEGRVLLTRDRGLLKRGEVVYGYLVRDSMPRRQLVEVIKRYNLAKVIQPFSLCLRCNAPLQAVAKEDVRSQLPAKTAQYYDEFVSCPMCKRVYWQGSHYARMRELAASVLSAAEFDSA